MQKLHLIGFTTDLDGLIFSARRGTKSGGFTVPVDDDLIRTIEEVMRLRSNGEAGEWEEEGEEPTSAWRVTVPQPESVLTPREIQARLRTGASLAEVAEEAGVDEDWVARFAPPVWAEQARIITRARALTLDKARVGPSSMPLGASVRMNIADRGSFIDDETFDAAWGAYHVTGTTWVVTFDPPGARRQVAMWQLDTATDTITAANRAASDLGYATGKGRKRNRQSEGASDEALARVARTATKKSAATREAAATKKSARVARAARKKAAAKRVVAKNAVPRKVAASRAAPQRKALPKKAAVRTSQPAKKAAAKRAPARSASAPARKAAKKTTKAPPAASVPALTTTGPAERAVVERAPVERAPVERATPAPPPAPTPVPAINPTPARPAPPEPAAPERDEAVIAAREERRRLREQRRLVATQSPEEQERYEAAPVRVAPVAPLLPAEARAEPREPAAPPAAVAAAVVSDEASGRVVRIHANRAAPTPAPVEPALSPRRTRQAERRRRRMFRGD